MTSIEARFARAHAQLRTIATTGTNGKTTTTSMVASIVAASGEPSARLTTVGAWVAGALIEAPSPMEEFLFTVERAVACGARTLALEVTSKSLSEGFARRWPPAVAVFTNLTRDHLDLHKTAEAYLASKAQLFMALEPSSTAVLNADDPSSALVAELIAPGVTVVDYSIARASASLSASKITVQPALTEVELAPSPLADALGRSLRLPLSGAVHAQNALAAALATHALGYSPATIRAGLEAFEPVAGRFEIVSREPLVVVDYAHTPDGLEGTLRTAREIAARRVLCVFGCGGDRDPGKRAEMGAIAHTMADLVVLTSDNPRSEDPARIAAMVREGASGVGARWTIELDRRAAITRAIEEAQDGDVVVIAGKGHEQSQEVQGRFQRFSDREVALSVIASHRRAPS